MKVTKRDYEEYLNLFDADEVIELFAGVPAAISSQRRDRITKPGTWLRRNDPVAFQVVFGNFKWRKGTGG